MTPACGFKWPKSGCFLQDKNKPKEVRRWCKRMKTQNNNSSIPVTPSHTGTSWWSGRGSRPDTSPPPESHKTRFLPEVFTEEFCPAASVPERRRCRKWLQRWFQRCSQGRRPPARNNPEETEQPLSTKLHLYRCSKCAFLLTCLWTFPAASVAFFKSSLLQLEKLMQQLVGMPLTEKYRVLNQLV